MPSSSFPIEFGTSPAMQTECNMLILGALQSGETVQSEGLFDALDSAMERDASRIASEEKFDGSKEKQLLLRSASGYRFAARRVIVKGLGESAKIQANGFTKCIRSAIESALSFDKPGVIAIAVPDISLSAELQVLSIVDALYEACYASQESKKPARAFEKVILLKEKSPELEAALARAIAGSSARSSAKDLTNMPPNLKRTATLVEKATTLSSITDVSVDVISDVEWIKTNMPCFYAVSEGSVNTDPPRFIRAHYRPASAKKKIIIVGKSVIFDTGGYQVKTENYMNTMKADMTGGGMALSILEACARLRFNLNLSAYSAATPNMIDAYAMLPDSIVNTTCGKKVEIRHTDAEGRLTLIDAVAKACEEKPDLIITIATLTGSAARAVGESIALMGNRDSLRDRLADSARRVGDPVQTLDIFEDDFDDIKSKLDAADIINTSQNKNRGAQSACAFVMSGLTSEIPLLHLDIAGADMTKDEKATGIGVKALMDFLYRESLTETL